MKAGLCICICVAITFATGVLADTKVVPPDQVPAPVWKTFQTATAGATPSKIERHEENGDVTYEATFASKNGGERSVSIAQDGKLLSLEVTLADVPAAVKKTLTEQVGEGKLQGIEKISDEDGISFDIDFNTKADVGRSMSIAEDGTLLSREVGLEEAPEAVQKTIKARVGSGTLGGIEQMCDPGDNTFDVEYTTKEGNETSFSVAFDGKLLSAEVLLRETPPLVQASILQKIGNGKVTDLRKIFDSKQKVIRYEVEAVVDGKDIEFDVGAKK